jgi:hypothetical protein
MRFLTGKRLSSPFSKGGPRGILLRGHLPGDLRSIQRDEDYYIPDISSGTAMRCSARFLQHNSVSLIDPRNGAKEAVRQCHSEA